METLDRGHLHFAYETRNTDGNPSYTKWAWVVVRAGEDADITVSLDAYLETLDRRLLAGPFRRCQLGKEVAASLATLATLVGSTTAYTTPDAPRGPGDLAPLGSTVIQRNAHTRMVRTSHNKGAHSRDCRLHRHQEHDSRTAHQERDRLREPFTRVIPSCQVWNTVRRATDRSLSDALLGTPAPIELGEFLSRFGRKVLRPDLAGQSNGHLDLLQVRGTVGADFQMRLESPSIPTGKRTFEIVGDEFDRLLTHDVSSFQRQHGQLFSISTSRISRKRARPRCSKIRWLPTLIPSTAHASSLERPSTSRNRTTWR